MFIVSLKYTSPLDQVEACLEEHVAYLKKNYEDRIFIASGRKVPRTGGVILAKSMGRDELQAILEQDPFHKHGVADYEVTEFTPTMTLPEFEGLKDV